MDERDKKGVGAGAAVGGVAGAVVGALAGKGLAKTADLAKEEK